MAQGGTLRLKRRTPRSGPAVFLVSPPQRATVEAMRFQTMYEGRWIFGFLLALAAGSGFLASRSGNPLWYVLLAVALLLILFCLNFFRDPERTPPDDPLAILAAADGVVADITEVEESEVLHRRVKRIGIFLNVFNVHVNKAPIDGKITYLQHHPGLFLDA